MEATGIDQAELRRRTGWSRRKASEICTGQQRYNRDSLNDAARAMNIAPFELLLHPADANEIKSLRAAVRTEALKLVADNTKPFTPAPDESDGDRLAPPQKNAR